MLLCARERVDLIASKLNSEDPKTVMRALGALESFGEFAGAYAGAVALKLPTSEPLPKDETWSEFHWIRIHAMGTLGAMGTFAAPYVDAIAACLELKRGGDDEHKDSMYRAYAAWALGKLGDVARDRVDAVAALLTTEETSFVRRLALKGLASFGPLAEPHVETIAQMLLSGDSNSSVIRAAAAETLGELGEVARAHVGAVAEMLSDDHNGIRAIAIETLGTFGPLANPHVDAVAHMLSDDDIEIRTKAVATLGKLGVAARDHVGAVAAILDAERQLRDYTNEVKRNAINALESFGTLGILETRHVEKLREKLWNEGEGKNVRTKAAKTLGALGQATSDDVAVVAQMLPDADALEPFGTFGELTEPHVGAIAAMLSDQNTLLTRATAAETLGKLGEIARDHVDAVAEMLSDGYLRHNAIEALGAFGKFALKHARHQIFKLDGPSSVWPETGGYREGVAVGKALRKMYGV